MDQTIIDRIEAQRLELETNIVKLRKALNHWTTLELDYEGLKDEFQGLSGNATKQAYLDAAHDFGPHKVDDKELTELIEPTTGRIRSPAQLVETLTKRTEYVTRNINSLRTQIADVEKRRNVMLLADESEPEIEAGLPISEITEELDDDGNVISSIIQLQGGSASKVLEVLEKAKVQPKEGEPSEINLPEERIEELDDNEEPLPAPQSLSDTEVEKEVPTKISTHDESGGSSESDTNRYPSNPNDTEEEAELRQEMLQYSGLEEIGNIVAELELAEGNTAGPEEDEEVGDVLSDFDEDDLEGDDFEDSMDNSDEDSQEDESGRSKGSSYSEKYKRQMERLQEQLGMKLENVGPTPDLPKELRDQIEIPKGSQAQEYLDSLPPEMRKRLEREPAKEAARKAALARAEAAKSSMKDSSSSTSKPKTKPKKSVAFAPELDIAEEAPPKATPKIKPDIATTSDKVVERSTSSFEPPSSSAPSTPAKPPSRFKAARTATPQTPLVPAPPSLPATTSTNPPSSPNSRITTSIHERPTRTPPRAPSPTDFTLESQRAQIALEHETLRRKIAHRQAAYGGGDGVEEKGYEDDLGEEYAVPEIVDPRTGRARKVSRFKAARMGL